MTSDLMNLIKRKKQAWGRHKIDKTQDSLKNYKILEEEVKTTVKRNKKQLEQSLASNAKTNPKSFYSYVNDKRANRTKIGPLRKDNIEISEDLDIAH